MKKKVIGTVVAAMMAVSALSVPVMAEDSEKPVTITYWGWDSSFYKPMMDAYMEEHPNVTFEVTATEWGDMLTKTQQALASGSDLPTIMPLDMTLLGNWKKMGILEDLKSYGLDTSIYNSKLIDAATDDDGKVIGLFEGISPAGIAYKRDLAKEYLGTDDPDELSAMFTSYDDYVEKGKEVSQNSDGKVYLFHSGQAVSEWIYAVSNIENVTDGVINMTDKMTEVLGELIKFRDAGAVDSYQNGTAEANATYTDDKHIFYPCPDWALSYYIEPNDPDGSGNWGLIKAPEGYSHGGTALGITSAASDEQKAAAYDFITWCVSSEKGATELKEQVGYITPDTTITTEDFCKRSDEEFFGGQNISDLFYRDIASNMSIATPSIYDNDIVSVRNDVAQQLMNDSSMTLDDAVEASIEELGQLVTDDSVTIK